MSNLVAIVGRPNVGESTLFNRLTQTRHAIVSDEAGTTRDRQYGKCEWGKSEFSVVDTGGWVVNSDDIFEEEIRKQVVLAIEEASVVLFMVEAGTGITDYDEEIADLLRRSGKPVVLAVNKVDSGAKMFDAFQFYSLGLGEVWSISAANGGGTGDLLDEIVKLMPAEDPDKDEHPELPHFTIVGKPNVGKSSLTNALLGKERNIVTPIAGTTRDSIATLYNKFGHEFMLVDTAGMRKKTKVHEDLEFYSVMRSIRAIEHSDVCILMIDAQTGIESQDLSIFNLIQRNKKGCVIVVNKWDTVEKDSNTMKEYIEAIKARLAPFNDLPIIFTSVINKQRIMDVLNAAEMVYENYSRKISTSRINEEMLPEIENYPPPAWKGKYIKIKYITQLPTRSPSFAFFCNLPQYIREPYRRFLENKLREKFDFTGCPVQIFLRQRSDKLQQPPGILVFNAVRIQTQQGRFFHRHHGEYLTDESSFSDQLFICNGKTVVIKPVTELSDIVSRLQNQAMKRPGFFQIIFQNLCHKDAAHACDSYDIHFTGFQYLKTVAKTKIKRFFRISGSTVFLCLIQRAFIHVCQNDMGTDSLFPQCSRKETMICTDIGNGFSGNDFICNCRKTRRQLNHSTLYILSCKLYSR